MSKKMSYSSSAIMVLAVGLLLLWTAPAMAQSPAEPDSGVIEPTPEAGDLEATPDGSNPPAYIADLVEKTDLSQLQVDQMRAEGTGWGNIRIAARLAEQMAANSIDTDTPVTFDDALASILVARAEGKGFGEIAGENNLKIGQLMRHRNQVQGDASGDGLEAEEGVQAGETVQVRGKKRGLFARLAGFLGVGKSKRPDKTERLVQADGNARLQKSSRAQKTERLEKPERPEKPSKPEKPERPERPAKPEKPEKPERGPRR